MTQYKFRGKRKDNGEWVYGSLLIRGNKSFIIVLIESRIPDYSVENSAGAHGYTWAIEEVRYEVGTETVGMWTGLKDKKGNEIYEGDTLRGYHKEQSDKEGKNRYEITDTVCWQMGGIKVFGKCLQEGYVRNGNVLYQFMWCNHGYNSIPNYYYQIDDIEIIGNLHLLNPAQGAVTNTMNTDPNLKAEEQATQASEGQINATESAAQDAAVGAEGSTEG